MLWRNKRSMLLMPLWVPMAAVLPFFAGALPALAVWDDGTKISASDPYPGDQFGYSVAVCGDVAASGARYDDDWGSDSGSAYIYRFNGSSWSAQQKLVPSDGAAGDRFGASVAVSASVAVVGAAYDDDNGSSSGSAYVFRYDGSSWIEEQKLLASDGAASDKFGYSVAISGNTIVVGAYGDDDNGSSSGSAYVFRFNGSAWVQEQKLLASDGAASDFFGTRVSVSDDVALIAADRDDDNAASSGSAYVFRYDGSTWIEEQKLVASDGAECDYFGCSVSLSSDVAVIGTYSDDRGANSGSAYVFRFDGSGWVEEAKLMASDGAEFDEFGTAVSVAGELAVIGAHRNNEMGEDAGAAYVFRFDGSNWIEETKLVAPDAYQRDEFGNAVAVCDNAIVVGAYLENSPYTEAGAAYIFLENASDPDCNGNGVPDDVDIANGTSEDCNANSIPDECDIADGSSEDCNANGVPDECDIADGTSSDCNGNGVPDECELPRVSPIDVGRAGPSSAVNGESMLPAPGPPPGP